ncbi:aquaporin [Streptomyces sp. NPDC097619]|uniref:aquaporin n=1 Tax=Streptomyces sp. NPDC097619 TaxID=3157228 RepID=UPI0033260899
MSGPVSLGRRALVEGLGTAALVAVVVGAGIQATGLSSDGGVRLLAASLGTVFGLGVLIALLGPVSGAHFNPAVTLAAWATDRRGRRAPGPHHRSAPDGPTAREVAAYLGAQTVGAIAGALLADAMFGAPLLRLSTHERSSGQLWLGELVATAGLVWLVLGLVRTGRTHLAPPLVAAYIGAAYWFTSSTSFANPAVTVGRAFTDTYAGIAPASVPPFLLAQLLGAAAGVGLTTLCFGCPGPDSVPVPVPDSVPGSVPGSDPYPVVDPVVDSDPERVPADGGASRPSPAVPHPSRGPAHTSAAVPGPTEGNTSHR